MRALVGELRQEIFVNAPEDIAGRFFQRRIVKRAQQAAEYCVVEFLVFAFGQDTLQRRVIYLDCFHRLNHCLRPVIAVLETHQRVKLRLRFQINRAFAGKILLGQRPRLPAAAWQGGFDFRLDLQVAAVRMVQKNQPHDGKKIFVAGVIAVCTQIIRAAPQPFFNGFDVFHCAMRQVSFCFYWG